MITHVAIKIKGNVYSLPKPNRHHHIIKVLIESLNFEAPIKGEHGFLIDGLTFINNKDAIKYVLEESKQCEKLISPIVVTSEDLW